MICISNKEIYKKALTDQSQLFKELCAQVDGYNNAKEQLEVLGDCWYEPQLSSKNRIGIETVSDNNFSPEQTFVEFSDILIDDESDQTYKLQFIVDHKNGVVNI